MRTTLERRLAGFLGVAVCFVGLSQPVSAQQPVSDDFNSVVLDTGLWEFVDPVGDGQLVMTGASERTSPAQGSAEIPVPRPQHREE